MSIRPRILTKKPVQLPGICILVENGVPCRNSIASRGLCGKHRIYLMTHGQLERYGLPNQPRKRDLRRNQSPVAGRRAKQQFGAMMFVTADGGILQYGIGVHPEKIVMAYPDVFGRR